MNTNKKGFAIASLITGILSITICCMGGSVFGIIGFILGIVSLCRRESAKGMAIGGIITSMIGVVVGLAMLALIFFIVNDETDTEQIRDEVISGDVFSGNKYEISDDSTIYFEEDGTFVWYQSDENHDDNYSAGTYDSYYGEEAIEYVTEDLDEYDVTMDELDDYFDRNAEDEFYAEENFCVLVLHNEEVVIDSEKKEDLSYDTPYMGFYEDGYYDAANMNTGSYASFTLQ